MKSGVKTLDIPSIKGVHATKLVNISDYSELADTFDLEHFKNALANDVHVVFIIAKI
ncbi:hypothetical protein MTR_2g017760 [Medicago truncatula]|uniref:Uncharacterized protein n=1 Tax=Medicago truncatula TaxID=3880 RepID=G7ILM3_MEDTR|nr:hypothetical protein MTR_2g017760 [Medicago truncatula]